MATVEVNGYTIGPNANLAGANLEWANLKGADLTGAGLFDARANSDTQWPDSFDPVAAGVTFE